MRGMPRSYASHDSCVCVIWLIFMFVWAALYSSTRWWEIASRVRPDSEKSPPTWPLVVCHDSCICVSYAINGAEARSPFQRLLSMFPYGLASSQGLINYQGSCVCLKTLFVTHISHKTLFVTHSWHIWSTHTSSGVCFKYCLSHTYNLYMSHTYDIYTWTKTNICTNNIHERNARGSKKQEHSCLRTYTHT